MNRRPYCQECGFRLPERYVECTRTGGLYHEGCHTPEGVTLHG